MDAGRPLHDTAPGPAAQPPSGALATLTLTELVHAVRGGTLSPADLVTEALASLDRWQPVTTAASQVWAEEALAAARALRPGPHLALPGIPVLVKENMDVAGHLSTGCCEAFRDRRASLDAQMVTRLRAAGAVVVGKANMHELAASATGHISACGPTHNPWDPGRLTGGSSGGSAAAVAARSVPLALGTDTAGSIRVPSSFCGVAGLKPTQGRLPVSGIMPLAPSLGCPGRSPRALRISASPSPSWPGNRRRSAGCRNRPPGCGWHGYRRAITRNGSTPTSGPPWTGWRRHCGQRGSG